VRGRAGQPPLAADPALRAVALGHSQDMARNHFFGHVSPTTGTLENRLQQAGVVLPRAGENISQAETPERAHEGLMDSPGHRANMLSPKFTHVGIAVVTEPNQEDALVATMVFGRRASFARFTADEAVEEIAALRKAKGAPPVQVDPALRAAAEQGIAAFAQKGGQAAVEQANAAFVHARRAGGSSHTPGCVHLVELLEPDQLEQSPLLYDPKLRRLGLAVTTRPRGNATLMVLLVLSEGAACP
jgi:uncharacterized protein YkwD